MADAVGIPDIEAFADVLRDLQDEATKNGMVVERAALIRDALIAMRKLLNDTIVFVESAGVTNLDGQKKVVGGTVYSPHLEYKYRPNHDLIQARTVEAAFYDVNGELIYSPQAIATRAVKLYHELYVAPMTKPKAAGLRAIRMSAEDATIKEHTGTSLQVTVIEGDE